MIYMPTSRQLNIKLELCSRREPSDIKMSVSANGRFMYFAFGSNLLKERLQLGNPSAMFHTTGRLKDHELNFGLYKKNGHNAWHGGVATIASRPGAEVWGVIWTLSNEDLPSLDIQEGVNKGIYSPLEVSVETDKGLILCRTYQMMNLHACPPSPQYKQVVCLGAKQNGLPVEYLKRLEAIQTNNYSGPSLLDKIRIDESSSKVHITGYGEISGCPLAKTTSPQSHVTSCSENIIKYT